MLEWLDQEEFVLDGLAFQIVFPRTTLPSVIPEKFSEKTFLIAKPRSMIEQYVELVELVRPRHVFEIGIYRGGSTVFLSHLADPDRLAAVDLLDGTTASFRRWLDGGPHRARVAAHFGVDQGDRAALRRIVAEEFDGADLDLVIDDASHLYGPTLASFHTLFPLLRPGGVYVIEDWESQHRIEQGIIDQLHTNPDLHARFARRLNEGPESIAELREPLTKVLVKVLLACAYSNIIKEIRIRQGLAVITRGEAELDPEVFDLSAFCLDLGRELLGELPPEEINSSRRR